MSIADWLIDDEVNLKKTTFVHKRSEKTKRSSFFFCVVQQTEGFLYGQKEEEEGYKTWKKFVSQQNAIEDGRKVN